MIGRSWALNMAGIYKPMSSITIFINNDIWEADPLVCNKDIKAFSTLKSLFRLYANGLHETAGDRR